MTRKPTTISASVKAKREIEYYQHPAVENDLSAHLIMEKSIHMDEPEFVAVLRPQLIHIDCIGLGWQSIPTCKLIGATIFGSNGTTTIDEKKINSIYRFYVRYKNRIWSAYGIEKAMEIVDAIRRHEIKEQHLSELRQTNWDRRESGQNKKKLKVA